MTGARWAAAVFALIGLAIYLRPVDYANLIIVPVFAIVGLFALSMALAKRPADRPALLLLVFGLFVIYGPHLVILSLGELGIDLQIKKSIPTAARWLDVTRRAAIIWFPLALVVAIVFWRRAGAMMSEPLSRALLWLRLLACMMLPSSLVALGSESTFGGVGISVFTPMVLLAWFSGQLAWQPAGDVRRDLLRRYGRLYAVVGVTTLAFVAARSIGIFDHEFSRESYLRGPNWRLLSLSEMGLPFVLLAASYLLMAVWLFKEVASQPMASSGPPTVVDPGVAGFNDAASLPTSRHPAPPSWLSNMTRARWAAAAFVVFGLALYLCGPAFHNGLTSLLVAMVWLVASGMALSQRSVDPVPWRTVGAGTLFLYGPGLCYLARDAAGFDAAILKTSLPTAARWLELTLRGAMAWVPIAIGTAVLFWRRTNEIFHQPLVRALFGLRLLSCVMAPSALVAIGAETHVGGMGISVFMPVILVAWSAGSLAWIPAGERRVARLRRHGRLFRTVGATTLFILAAQWLGFFEDDPAFASYLRNPNWRLLSLSEMGIPFTLLALCYLAMAMWLPKQEAVGARPAA